MESDMSAMWIRRGKKAFIHLYSYIQRIDCVVIIIIIIIILLLL